MLTGIGLLLVGTLAYQFLWGKLFPYSPVAVGFSKHESAHTVVYVQRGAAFDDFARIDSLTSPVETFHELKFIRKPRIYIFRDRESYLRRSISKARFCAFSTGIVVSPWGLQEALEGKISLEIYLRHELSHVLLFQHKGFLSELRYPHWLLEGIAMVSTDQMGTSFYPSREETYRLIHQGNFMPPYFFHTRREDSVKLDVNQRIAFIYSELGCIVDYLIRTGGRDRFLTYMKRLLGNGNPDRVFKEIYGIEFDESVRRFREYVDQNG
jgi:hypothetical protein